MIKLRTHICLFFIFIFIIILSGCAEGGESSPRDSVDGYAVEENQGEKKTTYPYVLHTESTAWYLAKDDIALLGEEEFFNGLQQILKDMEADFADARKALEGSTIEDVPSVDIFTDFCGKAGISETAGAYYNQRSNFIKVFCGWNMAEEALLHEYVHYLTMHCMEAPAAEAFFEEGIAEYISKIVCKNRMLRSINMGFSDEEALFYKEHGAWDEKEDCIDPKLFYFGTAQVIAQGEMVGTEYVSVTNERMVRTDQIQNSPGPKTVSFIEAGCIMAYLVDTYTEDLVFENLDIKPEEMESVFGEAFAEVYESWTAWNQRYCEELEIR